MTRQGRMNRRDVAGVLGCIVFALMALGAVGEGGRRRAQATVCQANLRLWQGIFQNSIEENDGQFLTGIGINGWWWPVQLPYEYQDWKRNRAWFCPTAVTPFQDERGVPGPIQSSFAAWGIYQSGPMHEGDKTYVTNANGLAGSYGLNGYMLHAVQTYGEGIPAIDGWPDLESIPEPDRVPLFLDALRFDLWPRAADLPAADEPTLWNAPRYVGQCCINRHNGAVNCLFVDGSVRKVGLKELWTLRWHRSFNTAGPWTTPGGVRPEHWPQWMRDFKEY